jgi:sensor domain CHASE-containing protein
MHSILLGKIHSRTVGMFLFTLALCLSLVMVMVFNRNRVERLNMEQLISDKSASIQYTMLRFLYRTETLAAYIQYRDGDVDNIQWLASMLIDDPAIRNMLIAPGGIVSDVYPLEGNEAVIGLDFLSPGFGNREAIIAKETRQLVMGGPFEGVQGGMLLVGRLPVFIGDEFWGIVSVTLNYPQVLEGAGLNELHMMGFEYKVWRNNPDTGERQVIAGREQAGNDKNFIEKPIQIVNAEWHFRLLAIHNWYTFPETWVAVMISLCLSLLVAAVIQNYQDIKRLRHIHDQDTLESHMNAMKVLVASLELQDDTTRQKRKEAAVFFHDLRHISQLLHTSLKNNDTEAAKELVKNADVQVTQIEQSQIVREMTGQRLLDAVICHYISMGRLYGIDIDVKMQRIDQIAADITELAVSLSNALENTVNACVKIEGEELRKVKVTGMYHGRQYFIEIANTTAKEVHFNNETGLPLRSPEQGEGASRNGFGTQSIQFFVKKNDAQLTYEYKDGWLYMRLLI